MKSNEGLEMHLFGIPKYIDIKKTMTVYIKQKELGNTNKGVLLLCIKHIIKYGLLEKKKYEYHNNDGGYLMMYGTYNYRFDHKKTFDDFSQRFNDADILCGNMISKNEIHPIKFIKALILFLIWFFELLFLRMDINEALTMFPYIYAARRSICELNNLPTDKYKFLIVYNDIAPDENVAVQFFKHINKPTMTMQHGIFAKKNKIETISDFGLEFTNSITNYYMAWNQYTKDEAINAGMDVDKIVVLGIPKYINFTCRKNTNEEKKNVFGVILNAPSFPEHNKKLIEMANLISKKYNKQYILRYHPLLKSGELDYLCNEFHLRNDDNKSTIEEYSNKVDFTIISSSSVFVDLIFLKHPTYRLIVSDSDTYSNVSYNSFSTIDEFSELISNTTHISKQLFDYLCTTEDVYTNYREFFDKFLIKEKN